MLSTKGALKKGSALFTTIMHKSLQNKALSQLHTLYKPRIAAILPVKSIIQNRSNSTISIAQYEQNTTLIAKDPQLRPTSR